MRQHDFISRGYPQRQFGASMLADSMQAQAKTATWEHPASAHQHRSLLQERCTHMTCNQACSMWGVIRMEGFVAVALADQLLQLPSLASSYSRYADTLLKQWCCQQQQRLQLLEQSLPRSYSTSLGSCYKLHSQRTTCPVELHANAAAFPCHMEPCTLANNAHGHLSEHTPPGHNCTCEA